MNTQIFTCGKSSTDPARRTVFAVLALILTLLCSSARAEWGVDFSRRVKTSREAELNAAGKRNPASTTESAQADSKGKGLFDVLFDTGEPIQDLVILQTDRGFVPSTVRVRKNGRYRIHVVNVNEKEKNVSFILDGFSEHHATYYGKIKIFTLEPKKEGTYSFQSPETSAEGKLVVFNPQMNVRAPAGADGGN